MDKEIANTHLAFIEKIYEEYFLARDKSEKKKNKAAVKKKGLQDMSSTKKKFKYYLERNEDLLLFAVKSDKMNKHAIFSWDDFFKSDFLYSVSELINRLQNIK